MIDEEVSRGLGIRPGKSRRCRECGDAGRFRHFLNEHSAEQADMINQYISEVTLRARRRGFVKNAGWVDECEGYVEEIEALLERFVSMWQA